jgi:hypothetical protein
MRSNQHTVPSAPDQGRDRRDDAWAGEKKERRGVPLVLRYAQNDGAAPLSFFISTQRHPEPTKEAKDLPEGGRRSAVGGRQSAVGGPWSAVGSLSRGSAKGGGEGSAACPEELATRDRQSAVSFGILRASPSGQALEQQNKALNIKH